MGYSFSIDQEETGYSFSTDSSVSFNLYTESGQYINRGNGEISGQGLSTGSYYFIIYDQPDTT